MLTTDELRLLKLVAPDKYGRDPDATPPTLTPGRQDIFDRLVRGGYCRTEDGEPLPVPTTAGLHVLQLLLDQGQALMLCAEYGESIKPQV